MNLAVEQSSIMLNNRRKAKRTSLKYKQLYGKAKLQSQEVEQPYLNFHKHAVAHTYQSNKRQSFKKQDAVNCQKITLIYSRFTNFCLWVAEG